MALTKSTQAFVQKMIDASSPFGINIRTLGCNENTDCAKVLTKHIMSFPVNSVINLFIPAGTFYFHSTLYWADRIVNIRGAARAQSIIYVAPGVDGIWIDSKTNSVFDSTLQDFAILGLAKIVEAHGIKVWQRARLINLEIQGFGGRGIWIDGYARGDMGGDDHHNACFAKVYDCYIASCKGDGIKIDGLDGNACVTFSNDIRNCGGWGLWDSSLLGGTHIGNMYHSNALGAMHVDGDVNYSTFIGGYVENDHGPNQFPNEKTTVYGGYNLAGNEGGTVR